MPAALKHYSLNATFEGVELGSCVQYRGIRYGYVDERFAEPTLLDDWNGKTVDCRGWGPRCPQEKYDVGYLLRAPEGDIFYDESEDEFGCLNLDVTVPKATGARQTMPVMIWVHGGSQIISYGNGASKIGDTCKLVRDSVEQAKPIIVVSIQYRLNMFHVGDGQGAKNLGFKDIQTAVEWVQKHIGEFGGDVDNIAIAGESAGAVFVHGLIVSGVKVKRAIMMSGSFYMSPPRSETDAKRLVIDRVLDKVQEKGYSSLKDAPVDVVVQSQAEIPIASVFMQQEECFTEWQTKTGNMEDIMVGDCEFESILWRNGVEAMSAEQIVECFDKAGISSEELKELYHINVKRAEQCRHGALEFMNDVVWSMPIMSLSSLHQQAGQKVYRYLFDQANPWQTSSRAHHGVDLVYLFGGFDMSMNGAAEAVSMEMRRRFISFVSGEAPWWSDRAFAFGPAGEWQEIDEKRVAARRRVRQVERMQAMDGGNIKAAFGSLAAGRISLHN